MLMKHLKNQKAAKMADLSHFSEHLGEEIPSISLDKIGKFRLQQLLRRKFGAGWKSIDLPSKIMGHFEKQLKAGKI